MKLSEICIKRPVFSTVLSLIIITIGSIFYTKLDIRDTPNIDPSIITVNSSYYGADAGYMESQITNRIEKALKNTKNLDLMTSTSSEGSSNIMLSFQLDTDIEIALNDVRSKISEISGSFPGDMKPPSVSKVDSDAFPSLWLSVYSDRHDDLELTRISDEEIKSVLEKLPTVGKSWIFGSRYYTMKIEPIPIKLVEHNISPLEIKNAVKAQNQDYPAGNITTESKDFNLRLKASLTNIKEFEDIIIKKYENGSLLRLSDVANIVLAPYENDVILRYNGKRSMAVGLIKQSTANVIQLSDSVRDSLGEIRKNLPPGVKIEVAYDAANQVRASIHAVFLTIFEAIILVAIVTYIFLASARITLIPLVTIPISLIGTFAFMYMLGFSINTFTMLAMILAIGLVVDDAIVMLENIYRHAVELGKPPIEAAKDAANEIGFAILAMTVTLASVFLPIGFIEGFLGKLFVEFAWTLAFCVLISGFVALTLTPMMTARMITNKGYSKFALLSWFDKFLGLVQKFYIILLEKALNHKIIFYLISLSSVGILVYSFVKVEKTFIPPEDNGFLQIVYNGPEGSNVQESEKTVILTDPIIQSINDIHGYLQVIGWGGGDKAFGFVPLNDWSVRKKSSFQIANELNAQFANIPGMSIFAFAPQGIGGGGGGGKAIEFSIVSPWSFDKIDNVTKEIERKMSATGVFVNIDRLYKSSTPTLDIVVDREKAYRYNVSLDSIGSTIQYLMAGASVGDFKMGNEIYDVSLRLSENDRNTITSLSKIMIKSTDGKNIPLDVVADIEEKITVKKYDHRNNYKSITITADLPEGYTLQKALKELNNIIDEFIDHDTMKVFYNGQIKQMQESDSGSIITFAFALIFIFLVLSAQFESFGDSLLILMAVPFSITGGVLALLLMGNTLNMYSNIGLVTLIGLVTKNSIMLVEFTNQLREKGVERREAIIEAAKLRLRPILMTSIATIFGALPLVLAHGAGAASRNSIGIVVVGGMIVGTIFTIFVIPVLYHSFKRDHKLVQS